MIALALLLAAVVLVVGIVVFLLTGNIAFLVLASIGLVGGVSGFVLTAGGMRER
jgi:hypothetical protein